MIIYFPILSIIVLFVFAFLSPVVYVIRKSLALAWLVALIGSLAGWVIFLLSWRSSPYVFLTLQWKPIEIFPESPNWVIDSASWSFAFALISLVVAVILTDVAREFEVESYSWAGSMALTGLGLLTVLSGNLISLMIGWTALDITDLILLLRILRSDDERRSAVIVFATRSGGLFLLLLGILVAGSQGSSVSFDRMSQFNALYLILAASFRLGVVPFHYSFWSDIPLRRGIGTISRLVIAAGSLVFLVRVASVGLSTRTAPLMLFLTGLAGLYAGYRWFTAIDELEGRTYWLLGMASLCLAAAIRGQQLTSLAWGVGLIFAGGFSFLYSSRARILSFLGYLFGLSLIGAPFTPSWQGSQLFGPPFIFWQVLFLFTLALLAAGLVRQSLKPADTLNRSERWVYLIYPAGLIILLFSYYLAGWNANILLLSDTWDYHVLNFLPAFTILFLSSFLHLSRQRSFQIPERISQIFGNLVSFRWLFALVAWLFGILGRMSKFISTILEGEGGVLWALLLVALFIAYITRGGLPGE